MSNINNSPAGKKGIGVGGCFAIGCAVVIALPTLAVMLMSGGGGAIGFILVAGLIIFLVIKSRKNAPGPAQSVASKPTQLTPMMERYYESVEQSGMSAPVVKNFSEPDDGIKRSSATGGKYANPLCNHTFTATELGAETVYCACGYAFSSADLKEFAELNEHLTTIESALKSLAAKIRKSQNAGQPAVAAKVAAATTVVEPAPRQTPAPQAKPTKPAKPAKPEKPAFKRPKVSLSLAQWLIFGASLLVMVAGVVFVSTTKNVLPQITFTILTSIIAAATGFGAFKTRKISVLFSNFLAAFSGAMIWATEWTLGEQLTNHAFMWDNRPAWWQTIEFVALAAVTSMLAKLSKNFGFKAIALLSATAAPLVYSLGVLNDPFLMIPFGFGLCLLTASAVLVLTFNRWLRGIPQADYSDKSLAAYFKDLAEREDKTLGLAGLIAAGILMISAAGTLTGNLLNLKSNGLTLLVFAAIWVPINYFSKFWVDQLGTNSLQQRVLSATKVVPIFAVAVSATLLSANITDATAALLVSLLAMAAIQTATLLPDNLRPSRIQLDVALYVGIATWLTVLPALTIEGIATFLFGASLVFGLSDLLHKSTRFSLLTSIVGPLSMLLFAQSVRQSQVELFNTFGYALIAVTLVLLVHAHVFINKFVAKRAGAEYKPVFAWIAVAFAAVTTYLMAISSSYSFENQEITSKLTLLIVFLIYSAVLFGLESFTKLGKALSAQLSASAYVGQSLTLFAIAQDAVLFGSKNSPTFALLVSLITVVTYGFGALKGSSIKMRIGYATLLGAIYCYEWSISGVSISSILIIHLLLIAGVTWLHSWVLRKRTENKNLTISALLGIASSLLVVPLIFAALFNEYSETDEWLVLATAGFMAVAATVLSELKVIAKVASRLSILRWASLMYAGFGLITVGLYLGEISDYASLQLRLILALAVLSAIVMRQNRRWPSKLSLLLPFAANLAIGTIAALYTLSFAGTLDFAPEIFSAWLAVALSATTLLSGEAVKKQRAWFAINLPVLMVGLSSWLYAELDQVFDLDRALIRVIPALLVLTALSYWRSRALGWLIFGYLTSAVAALHIAQATTTWANLNIEGPEIYSVLAAVSVFVSNLFLVRRLKKPLIDLRYTLLVLTVSLPSLSYAISAGPADQLIRGIAATALLVGLTHWRVLKSVNQIWIGATWITSLGLAAWLALAVNHSVTVDLPDMYSLLFAASVLTSAHLTSKATGSKLAELKNTLPMLVATLPTLFYAVTLGANLIENQVRGIAASALLTAYSYWRLTKGNQKAWAVAGYTTTTMLSVWIAFAINRSIAVTGPELYSLLVAAALLSSALLVSKLAKVKLGEHRFAAPLLVATLPSLLYAVANDAHLPENYGRGIAASVLLTAYSFWRIQKTSSKVWAIASYATSSMLAAWIGFALNLATGENFAGPELYTLPIAGSLLLTARFVLSKFELKSSLIRWGLPATVALVPSIIYSYAALQTPFELLGAIDVSRVVLALVAAAALLVLGIRRGSLGLTVTGLIGLGLLIVPNVAVRSAGTGTQIDTTALVIGCFVFALLSILRQAGKLQGNSLLFIGIPVSLALGPALVSSLAALGNGQLQAVDWWRFSIVLISGLVLLFVGAMREVAGMFYPGLITVLVASLPYGFSQSTEQSWLLWVVLLMVAGIMVWLALRLEKMKKLGKSSSVWLKELK